MADVSLRIVKDDGLTALKVIGDELMLSFQNSYETQVISPDGKAHFKDVPTGRADVWLRGMKFDYVDVPAGQSAYTLFFYNDWIARTAK